MAKRRANKEGTIYKRSDGRWCAQVSIHGSRLTHYATSQSKCREWIKKTVSQIEVGYSFTDAKYKLAEYLKEWLNSHKDSVRQNTWIDYRQLIQNHINPVLGNIKLKELNPGHIQHLINLKRDGGLGPWTLSFIRQVLHTSLQQAVAWGMIASNPAKMVIVPRIPKKEMHVWTKDQVKTFLNSLSGSRLRALYYMAVTTGLRQGELLGLLWSDVDWENKRINLSRQLRRVREKGLQFEELKTDASRRTIYLGNSGVLNLNQHNEHQEKAIRKSGSKWNYRDIIFPSTIGTPLSPRNLYRHFIETTQKNRLPRIRFHDLRHTAATLMLNEGVHPKVVQERLGHSSISITLDVYSHIIPSMQETVAEKLDNLLL